MSAYVSRVNLKVYFYVNILGGIIVKKIFVLLSVIVLGLLSCKTNEVSEEKTEPVNKKNLGELIERGNWFPTTDSYGSSFICHEDVVVDGEINVEFDLVKKDGDDIWPYIELICGTGSPIVDVNTITIEYKCSKSLQIKLSQSDFGGSGDGSYAHYFIEVPATDEWSTVTVDLANFAQPSWAPEASTAIALNREKITDIYLVPTASYQIGEKASLSVRSLVLK